MRWARSRSQVLMAEACSAATFPKSTPMPKMPMPYRYAADDLSYKFDDGCDGDHNTGGEIRIAREAGFGQTRRVLIRK